MISLVLAIALGLVFTFAALQNPQMVTIRFFDFATNLPLYIIGAMSFLAGIFITSLFSLFDGTTSALYQREGQVHHLSRANESLQHQAQRLANENAELRDQLANTRGRLRGEQWQSTKERIKNFFNPVRHHPI